MAPRTAILFIGGPAKTRTMTADCGVPSPNLGGVTGESSGERAGKRRRSAAGRQWEARCEKCEVRSVEREVRREEASGKKTRWDERRSEGVKEGGREGGREGEEASSIGSNVCERRREPSIKRRERPRRLSGTKTSPISLQIEPHASRSPHFLLPPQGRTYAACPVHSTITE